MSDYGRAKFEAFRLKLLFLSGAVVAIPACLLSMLCGGGMGRELMVDAGWEVQVFLGVLALAGAFLFVYVEWFMHLPPDVPPPGDGTTPGPSTP